MHTVVTALNLFLFFRILLYGLFYFLLYVPIPLTDQSTVEQLN